MAFGRIHAEDAPIGRPPAVRPTLLKLPSRPLRPSSKTLPSRNLEPPASSEEVSRPLSPKADATLASAAAMKPPPWLVGDVA